MHAKMYYYIFTMLFDKEVTDVLLLNHPDLPDERMPFAHKLEFVFELVQDGMARTYMIAMGTAKGRTYHMYARQSRKKECQILDIMGIEGKKKKKKKRKGKYSSNSIQSSSKI